MGERRHPNAKLDDGTWRALLGRWHAGEAAAALRGEAGVSRDTWRANAARLGMRLKDLPEGHPARRRTPPHAERPDDWKHPLGALTEGQWRALFALRARGAPDVVLASQFGVAPASICWQAKRRGLARPGAVVGAADGPAVGAGPGKGPIETLGVRIDPGDRAGALAGFDAAIATAAAAADFARVVLLCQARGAVDRAMFGGGRASVGAARAPSSPGDDVPPPEGEGEAALVLRAAQRAPGGRWGTWLFLGGRGAGKTLAGASWIADQAEAAAACGGRLALVGPTLHDVREVMIGGPSGVLALPRWGRTGARPAYEPTRRRLVFPSGAVAMAFSSEDPESLRGPQFGAAWADELCAWKAPGATLALLRLGLRLGADPRLAVTTTPKPIAALRRLMAEPGLVMTRAGTAENAAHLAGPFLGRLMALYGGTRLAAQELEGVVVEAEGPALWTAGMLAACRGAAPARGALERVVVAVDPPAGTADGRGGSACGVVVAGRAGARAWVLADRSVAGASPAGWAWAAARAAAEFAATAVVAEANQGGEMVRAVLQGAGVAAPLLRLVRASAGKRARAEPVAALYEQGRVTHCGELRALEEELMALGGAEEAGPETGTDRADALVWALSELLLGRRGQGPRLRVLEW